VMSSRNIVLTNTHTLSAADNDTILVFASDDPVTVNVPPGLGGEFECGLVQYGAGAVTVTALAGAQVSNRGGHAKLAGRSAFGALVAIDDDDLILSGDTA
jgi:hypothetical protein